MHAYSSCLQATCVWGDWTVCWKPIVTHLHFERKQTVPCICVNKEHTVQHSSQYSPQHTTLPCMPTLPYNTYNTLHYVLDIGRPDQLLLWLAPDQAGGTAWLQHVNMLNVCNNNNMATKTLLFCMYVLLTCM